MRREMKKSCAIFLLLVMIVGQSIVFADTGSARTTAGDAYKWDLSVLYKDRASFDADVALLKESYIPKVASFKGKMGNPDDIIAYFQVTEELMKIMENVYMYPNLLSDLNQDNSEATEMAGIASAVYTEYSEAASYAIPEMIALGDDKIKSLMEDPKMKDFVKFFDSLLKEQEYILSEEEEKILAMTGDLSSSPRDIFDKVTLADYVKPEIIDETGHKLELSSSAYYDIIENGSRYMREKAYNARYNSYIELENTLAATLNAEIKSNIFYSKVRGFDSALEASLHGEHIDRAIYDNLVSSVNKNLDYLHKYYGVRKKAMNLDALHRYDCYVPLADDYSMEITYDEGVELVKTALTPLGETYLNDYQTGVDSRWIDVYEDSHKYTGAYSWSNYNTHPFILMNYNNSLDSTLTFAHEMGHGLNSVYSNREQSYGNADYPIFTAEVASTVNELLVMDHLIKNAKSDDEKLFLLNKQIDNIVGTVYTQVMFAEFEQMLHEKVEAGEALSADSINSMWLELMTKYYGPHHEVSEISKAGWGRVPHFYMNFYVYKYATSMSAAYEIVNNITTGKEGAVDQYIKFLGSGGSEYPVETLLKAGVDMRTSAPVDNILAYFGTLVDELEILLENQ